MRICKCCFEGEVVLLVARIGLRGVCARRHEEATEMNKRALRAAVRTSSLAAESVVCANMAYAGEHSGELETARLCLHRHQQLVSSLRDRRAEGDAQLALGELEVRQTRACTVVEVSIRSLTIGGGSDRTVFFRTSIA
eukprot:464062-Pleurochrysis_carterae.AAC.2